MAKDEQGGKKGRKTGKKATRGFKTNTWAGIKNVRARNPVNIEPGYTPASALTKSAQDSGQSWDIPPSENKSSGSKARGSTASSKSSITGKTYKNKFGIAGKDVTTTTTSKTYTKNNFGWSQSGGGVTKKTSFVANAPVKPIKKKK